MRNLSVAFLLVSLAAIVVAMHPHASSSRGHRRRPSQQLVKAVLPPPFHTTAARQRRTPGRIRLASNHPVTYRASTRPAARPRVRMPLEVRPSENPLHSGLHRRAASTQCAVPANTHHSSHHRSQSHSTTHHQHSQSTYVPHPGHAHPSGGYYPNTAGYVYPNYPYTQNRLMNEGSGEGSGFEAEFGSGLEPKENVSTFVSSRVHTDIHPHTQHGYRMMIGFKIDDETYNAMFDTGSATTWVPIREGCDVQPADCVDVLNYGTCDVSRKTVRGNFCAIYGPMAMENRPSATGRAYRGTFTVGSGSHVTNIEALFGGASTIRNIHFPIFGASPPQGHLPGGSIPLAPVLHGNVNTFSVYISESHTDSTMPVGEVLFDGQSSNCEDIDEGLSTWMPDATSAGGFWMLTYQTVVYADQNKATVFDETHEGTAMVDSGNPYLLLPRRTFEHLLGYITATVGADRIHRPGNAEYEIDCSPPVFGIDIMVDGMAFRIGYHKLIEEYAPGRCRLLLFYTDSHPIFGVPFFRSACVNHDTEMNALGVSLLKGNE